MCMSLFICKPISWTAVHKSQHYFEEMAFMLDFISKGRIQKQLLLSLSLKTNLEVK